MLKHRRWITVLVTVVMLWICVLDGYAEEPEATGLPILRVHQIEVGSASAYLIMVEDTTVMVDCGTNTTEVIIPNNPLLEYIAAAGVDHMDAHFVTHYHNDHASQIDFLSELYGNDQTVLYGPSPSLPSRFLPLPNGEYRQLKDNDEVDIGPLHFLCLGPESADITGEVNRDSLNFLMTYGDTVFFFTGDYVASDMVKRHGDLLGSIDVMTFPHHGLQPFAITTYVLSQIPASVVLIASNAAGPARVYCQHNGLDAKVYGSGQFDHIVVETDGKEINVETRVQPGQFAGK